MAWRDVLDTSKASRIQNSRDFADDAGGFSLNGALNDDDFLAALELNVKYAGYVARQQARAHQVARMEGRRIPNDMDYTEIRSLSTEGREKLMKYKPLTLGQAGRIAGVSPADIAVLMIYLKRREG
ncbi:hypothetical protein KKB28_02580 [bacterium]|nr:hypothetical protein [bacterium]